MASRKPRDKSEEQKVNSSVPTPDEAPNPVIRMSAKGKTLYSNPKARSVPGLVDPQTYKIDNALVKSAKASLKSGLDTLMDYLANDKCYEMIINPNAEMKHINIYGRDVTEARASVENISDLAKFPSENPNPVLRAMPNGSVLFANVAARTLSGAIVPGSPGKLCRALAQAAKSASHQGAAVDLSHKSNNKTYLLTFAPVEGEKYLNVYGREITAEIKAQRALAESNELLERRVAERTASVRLLQNIVLAANNAESLESALQTALHEICIYTGWQVGHAYVVEHNEGKSRLIPTGLWKFDAASRYSNLRLATEHAQFSGEKNLPGAVLKSGKAAWVENMSLKKKNERFHLAKASGLTSSMAFPVLSDGSVVGVLEFFSKSQCSASAEIAEILDHIGTQLGSVAKRKNAEIAVAASQADAAIAHSRLSNAIEVLGQGFALFDVEDNLVLFNKRYSDFMFEYGAPEPKVGKNFADIVRETTPIGHEDDTSTEKEAWVQAILKERRENTVYGSIERTGTGRWLRAEGFDTEEGGTVSIFTDISDAKKHEHEQAELAAEADLAHSRLNDAIEAIGQGFALFDSDDKYVLFNERYQKMKSLLGEEAQVGATFESCMRNSIRTDFGDETKEEWLERVLISRNEGSNGLVTDELEDGTWFLFERYETGEKGKVDIFTDVTDMKNHEAELDALVKELGIARDGALEANSAKSQFLANMSHELRTPLNAIIGYSELLIDEVNDNENRNYVPDLEKIQTAGKHLLGLINDILDLSKIEVGKAELFIEEFDVKSLLDDVSNTIKPLVDNNRNTLEIHISNDVKMMISDATKLRQNLFNLLSNAAKFSKDSILSVQTSLRRELSGDLVVFKVTDHGIGMTPEHLDKAFEPFTQADSTTSKRFGGTGLGLSITREFCRMMGGDITVASELGVGTTFTMTLALNAKTIDNLPEMPPPSNSHSVDDGAPLVLIIDDDHNVRELLQRNLTSAGYRTEIATNGKEGLQRALDLKPSAITLDVIMPEADGWSVLAALQSDNETKDIPVIMVTIVEDRKRGFSLGASDYLSKPIDRRKLIDVLKRYLGETASRTVLLVEDDASSRAVIRRNLQDQNVDLIEAENGLVGIEKLSQTNPSLILLDLMMPEMDGFGFVDEYRKNPNWHDIPIIVVTAKKLTKAEKNKLDGWVEGFYSKLDHSVDQVLKDVCKMLPTTK